MKYAIKMVGQGSGVIRYFNHFGRWDWLNEKFWVTNKRISLPGMYYGEALIQTTIFKGKFNADLVCNRLNQYFIHVTSGVTPAFSCEVIPV